MIHRNCGGQFVQYRIPEHHYCFIRCERCSRYLGGDRTAKTVQALMDRKVRPHISRS